MFMQGPSKYFTLAQKLGKISNLKYPVCFQSRKKIQFIKLDISNWRMSKVPKIPVQIDRRFVCQNKRQVFIVLRIYEFGDSGIDLRLDW